MGNSILEGLLKTSRETREIGGQVAQQGAGTIHHIYRCYLLVNDIEFKLYRFTKKEIEDFVPVQSSYQQQQQTPLIVLLENYYLEDKEEYNDKHVKIEGDIDFGKNIVYDAKIKL